MSARSTRAGLVSLVGAGPLGPDFLTVKALRRIEGADVILYDALIGEGIRALFPPSAVAISVGKRCGLHSFSQHEINRQLITHALKGCRVVRLKGGDPFLFGRGGEEALALANAGIPWEVVPGVSSVNAMAALSGIPLTHRGSARRVMIIEGHTLASEPPDWQALVDFDGTIVVLMGAGEAQVLATRLIAHGAETARPIALLETDANGKQLTQTATLAEAAKGTLPRLCAGPGIIYIGAVVNLRKLLVQDAGALRVSANMEGRHEFAATHLS